MGCRDIHPAAPEIFTVVRNSVDGKFRLTQFIKLNVQPRMVFVSMTVKNLDTVQHIAYLYREVAPAIDGNASDDQYNELGRTGSGTGATGQALQATPIGANSLLFGATQSTAFVRTGTVADFQAAGGCGAYPLDPPGSVTGGSRVLEAGVPPLGTTLAAGASANFGKFVYRML
jgi:hypothetical protein